jgi:hypothetical protein
MTLGRGSATGGLNGPLFYTEADRGRSIITGLSGGPVEVQWDFVEDDPDILADVVSRSLQARHRLGIANHGQPDDEVEESMWIIEHVLGVVGGDESTVWSSTVAERLAERDPGRYAGWTGPEVSNALNAAADTLGLTFDPPLARPVRVTGHKKPQRGYHRADLGRLQRALTDRRHPDPA